MNKLSELMKKGADKFKSLSTGKKIAFCVLFVGILSCIIYLSVFLTSTKYDVLFANMDATEAKKVTDALTTKKVSYKVKGNSIYVPTDQRDELRMEILGDSTINSEEKGWTLFDSTSQFGQSDTQTQVEFMRALKGELEKTIKSFPQVDNAIVNLVLSEDSAFVTDTTPASASVYLKLKNGQSLTKSQVRAIIMLVSGSVKNLPKENVQVIDDNMKLISQGVFDGTSTDTSTDTGDSTNSQQQIKAQVEKYYENKALQILKPVYGDKINVTVDANLNFDAITEETKNYSPTGTVVSEHDATTQAGSSNGNTATSNSPVDNNMVNSGTTGNSNSSSSSSGTSSSTATSTTGTTSTNTPTSNTTTITSQQTNGVNTDITKNYEISTDDKKIIVAPGSIKRLTAAVVINGQVDANTQTSVTNLVNNALGINSSRGDIVSVEGIPYDTTAQTQAQKMMNEMNAQEKQAQQTKQMYTFIAIGAAALAVIAAVVIILLKKRKKDEEELEDIFDETQTKGLDVTVGDNIIPEPIEKEKEEESKEKVDFKPLDLEPEENEQSHNEKEIKKYALEKPEQVVEIIKAWLAEDER